MTAPSQPARYPAWGKYFAGLTKDLAPEEVTTKLGVSQTMVSRWSKGSARPDIARAKEVATLFDGNPEDAERAIRADSIKTVTTGTKAKAKTKRRPAKKAARKPAKRVAAANGVGVGNARSNVDPLVKIRASRSAVTAAQKAIATAERELDEAVNAARSAGCGWTDIASALG